MACREEFRPVKPFKSLRSLQIHAQHAVQWLVKGLFKAFAQVVVHPPANSCCFDFQLPCTLTRICVILKCVAQGDIFQAS